MLIGIGIGLFGITVIDVHDTAPVVVSLSPTDNNAAVSVSATSLIITFDEGIQFGATASVRLYKTTGDVLVQEWTEAEAMTLVIDAEQLEMILDAPLEPGVDYYVQVDAGSVEDLFDNPYAGIADETTWNFTTAALVPSAFVLADWDLVAGDESANVTINSLPAANGAAISDIDYRIDGGSWVSTGGTTSFTISGLTNDVEYDVELRAVNSVGDGAASDVKAVTPEASTYVGPGDLVSGALVWWGLRAYSAATIGNNAIDLERASDHSTQTFATVAGGGLDDAAIATFMAATTARITKWYDHTGNGHDQVVAYALAAEFTPNAIGSLPGATFLKTNLYATLASVSSSSQPFSVSSVFKCTLGDGAADQGIVGQPASSWTAGISAVDTARTYSGSGVTRTATDNTFHAMQNVFNGASSHVYIDGADTSGNAGTTGLTNNKLMLGRSSFGGMAGVICEAGIWASKAFDGTEMGNLDTNQQTYWGF